MVETGMTVNEEVECVTGRSCMEPPSVTYVLQRILGLDLQSPLNVPWEGELSPRHESL